MKDKIISSLKNKYSNLGLGDKAFDGVANFLEKTVTEESDIENVVSGEDVKTLLKAFQSESDSLRGKNAELTRRLSELEKPEPKTPEPPTQDNEDKIAKLLARIDALETRNRETESREKKATIIESLKDRLKRGGSNNEAVLNLVLKGIEVKDGDTADSLVESAKSTYDSTFKEFYGDGVVPPAGGRHIEGYQRGDFSGEVARLRAEGKLPKE